MKAQLLFLVLFSVPTLIASSSVEQRPISEAMKESFAKAFSAHVTLQQGGTLLLDEKAGDVLDVKLVDALEGFIDTVNESIADGRRVPFTAESLKTIAKRPLCECLLGCCQNGICAVNWGNGYIAYYDCDPHQP
jgi:hypothetical protein